jgi:chorismate mutase
LPDSAQLKELVHVTQASMGGLTVNAVKADANTSVEFYRQEIDMLDSQIIDLIQSRHQVSFRIQQRRQEDGGPRTVLAREMVVMDRYRQALGSEGTALATDILRLCRGQASESAVSTPAEHGESAT